MLPCSSTSIDGLLVRSQAGFIAVLYAAVLALVMALTVGALVAQLGRSGALNRATTGAALNQQSQLVAFQQRLSDWYRANAWQIDSQAGQPDLALVLAQAGIVAPSGMMSDVSEQIVQNGVGYHVIACWFPLPGASGVGLDHVTGRFSPGILQGQPAQTPYVLISGLGLETALLTQTRGNLNAIADKLAQYFAAQQVADADMAADVNWFCDSACSTNGLALPCYGNAPGVTSAVPILQTDLAQRIGLSPAEQLSAWTPNSRILVNNHPLSGALPFVVSLYAALPWGGYLTVQAVSG